MDYFGRVVDELTEIWERIEKSADAEDGAPVQRALERAMRAAVKVENARLLRQAGPSLIGHNGAPEGSSASRGSMRAA